MALATLTGHPARAQYIQTYFPTGVPGYDTNQGVTVLSRAEPLYQPPGISAESFVIRPQLDEGFGYDSNPAGIKNGGSSAFLQTSPSVSANSNWSRDALGLYLSADNNKYFKLPKQSYTNWTAAVGGGYTIGRSDLSLAYSHLSLNQNATDVGAVQSDTPVHYSVDDVRSGYTFDLGRISIAPMIDIQNLTFSNTTVSGETVSQSYRNRVVLTGGAAAYYSLSEQRRLVVVLQGVDSHYTDPPVGQPSNNSTSLIALGGLDYQATGPWRYQLLVGVEERSFSAAQFKSHVAPIVQGQAIWTPTGLTTITGSVARVIEDPAAQGSAGYTYTTAQVVVDHELYRNVRLQGRTGVQLADYLQGGGDQTSYTLGAGVNWLLNRNLRLSLDYNFTTQTGSQVSTVSSVPNLAALNSGSFSRNIALLALHFAL